MHSDPVVLFLPLSIAHLWWRVRIREKNYM
jgi:hypothetical protein